MYIGIYARLNYLPKPNLVKQMRLSLDNNLELLNFKSLNTTRDGRSRPATDIPLQAHATDEICVTNSRKCQV